MTNLKSCSVVLLMLGLLLTGCANKPAAWPPSSLPVMPELPASARQGKTPPQCSSGCLVRWSQKGVQWQKLLTVPDPQGLPVSESMTE